MTVHGGERHGKINREKRKRRDHPESEQVKGTVFLYTFVDRADLVFKTAFNFLLKKPACNEPLPRWHQSLTQKRRSISPTTNRKARPPPAS